MNITEELGKHLREFATELLVDKDIEIEDFCRTEGNIRDYCYNETCEIFDDAMDEFTLSEVIDDAIEVIRQKIKDYLYERTEDVCCNEDEIDKEIDKLEKQMKRLEELDDQ